MALRAPVYAGNITNLSDARYFAGMGVQWLGFQIDPNQTSYLNPQKFREIVGWVTGPALVLEPQPNISTNDLTQLAGDYGIDLLRLLPQAAYAGPCGYYLDSPMTSPSVQSSAFIIIDPGTTEPVEIFYD